MATSPERDERFLDRVRAAAGLERLRPGLEPVVRRLGIIGQLRSADEGVEPFVDRSGDVLGPFLGGGIAQPVGRPGQPPTVELQAAVRRVDP